MSTTLLALLVSISASPTDVPHLKMKFYVCIPREREPLAKHKLSCSSANSRPFRYSLGKKTTSSHSPSLPAHLLVQKWAADPDHSY